MKNIYAFMCFVLLTFSASTAQAHSCSHEDACKTAKVTVDAPTGVTHTYYVYASSIRKNGNNAAADVFVVSKNGTHYLAKVLSDNRRNRFQQFAVELPAGEYDAHIHAKEKNIGNIVSTYWGPH